MAVTSADVRRARALLVDEGIDFSAIPPQRLATAAKELGRSLTDVLRLVMTLQMGGQGRGPAPIAERIAMKR